MCFIQQNFQNLFLNLLLEFMLSNDIITLTFFIDNSVKYIHSTNSSTSENSRDHKQKTDSNPRKRNKKHLQNNKKFLENNLGE